MFYLKFYLIKNGGNIFEQNIFLDIMLESGDYKFKQFMWPKQYNAKETY